MSGFKPLEDADEASTPRTLSAAHRGFLARHAIDPDRLARQGAYTAETPADLPARIHCPVPALCFPLTRLSGGVVWQARPDRPAIRRRPDGKARSVKYVAQWGESGVIVNATGGDAWRGADTILLCEGTKQSIVAAEYAPQNTAAIGILGCSNWTTGGVPADDLVELVRSSKARRIVVAFDADVRTNVNVWKAASRLRATLGDLPATVRPDGPDLTVLFSTVQNRKGTAKADIDGVLGGMTEAERAREIARIVDEAKPLDPWGGTMDLPVSVRPDLGLTLRREENTEDPSTPPDTLPSNTVMNAALSIETAWQWLPDPARPDRALPDTRLDLRMDMFRPGRPPEVAHIPALAWADLTDLGSLTLKASGRTGLTVAPPASPAQRAWLLEALRRGAEHARLVRLTPRTGWQADPETGESVWVAPQGAIGADGWNDDLQARTNEIIGRVRLSRDIPETDTAMAVAYLTGLLRRLTASELRADVCLGAFALGLLPIPPKCAVALFGVYSQGKSTLMQIYSSLLSPDWTPRRATSEFNFYATENAIGNSMDGVNGMPVFYDDMRMPKNKADRTRLNDIFDAIVRRSHGSQAKMRSTVRDGRVQIADRDDSQPLAFIVGERIPSDAAASALSRVYQVPMDTGQSLRDGRRLDELIDRGDVEAALLDRFSRDCMTFASDGPGRFDADAYNVLEGLYRLTDSPAWRAIVPGFVGYLAARWRTEDLPRALEDRRSVWQNRVVAHPAWRQARHDGVRLSTREAIIVAGLMTGLETWLDWAAPYVDDRLDAALAEPVDALRDTLDDVLDAMVRTHLKAASNAVGDDVSEQGVLDRLRAAVASGGRVRIKGVGAAREREYRATLGVVTTIGGRPCVAIDPNVAVGEIRGFEAMGPQDVADALAGVAIPDRRGSLRRPVRINGASTRCVCIPLEVWDDGATDAEENQVLD